MQSPDESGRGDAAQRAQGSEQDKHQQRARIDRHGLEGRHLERRCIAEEPSPHERRSSRGDRDRQERLHAHLRQHQLHGEHHASNRCVEGGRDARPSPCSDQRDPLTCRHADDLPQSGAKRRPDLNNRAFPTDRGAAANCEGRGQGLDQSNDGSNDASLVVDRIHDFRDPMTFGLGRKVSDQEGHADGTQHWNQDHKRTPGSRRGEDVRVVVDDRVTGE